MVEPQVDTEKIESLVGQIADEFTEQLNRGEQPDIEEYASRHPELATVLRQVLPALRAIRNSGSQPVEINGFGDHKLDVAGCLGDFKILREIGRGGMGVVYEAEQISLRRRVALKVLPFAGMLDERQLARFRNEAHAAAQLHHTNIVPVYAVGCDRGVHYYAMQFIQGQTLAEMIAELRRDAQGPAVQKSISASGDTQARNSSVTADTLSQLPDRFRAVAQLGIQAAEALEYAHREGVVHRDIKPANLLLDARGTLWVTDFGLARIECESNLTLTGDLVGTLRYMSPEQARSDRGVIDHRSDIYSLGATLYVDGG